MPWARPASNIASQTARAWSAGTLISKPSSPVNDTRNSRVGTPQIVPERIAICGKASGERSMPSTRGAITARAFGPCSAITAHCSVIEVRNTSSSGHSVWR